MLGALGALIRKDERTLFNKHTDGLYVSAPKLLQEMEEEFTEELGYEIQRKLLDRWPFDTTDKLWNKLKIMFEQCRLRILYTSEESHEWVLYINNNDDNNIDNIDSIDNIIDIDSILLIDDIDDLQCLGGVYQKFNFEFGDGKFHDIVSMGTTNNIGWDVLNSSNFDPFVLCNVGNILNLQRKINNKYGFQLPSELWHIILGFSIDCFQPITQMMEVDIVLRDVRRWTQNLYLSENLRRRDEFGDKRIRKLGQLFIEIGGMIDSEYIKYRKQFSLRKKFVRFMKFKFGQITNETSQKLKNLKNKQEKTINNDDKNNNKQQKNKKNNNHKKRKKKRRKKQKHDKKRKKHNNNNNNNNINNINNDNDDDIPSHLRCHTIDVGIINKLNNSAPPLTINKSADLTHYE